jgi:hypothetical protein
MQTQSVLFASTLLAAATAWAEGPTARELSAYERGSAADQLETDITPIPVGMGAIFVPSSTQPGLEPPVLVFFGEDRVAAGRTGERIILPPGEYEVVTGHGNLADRPRTKVKVLNGVTTPTPDFFGALRISAVDPDNKPVEIDYLVEAGGKVAVSSTTAASKKYGKTRTWLMPAGPVTITLLNGDRSTRNALQIPLAAGQLARYRLVMDANRLVRADMAERELVARDSPWKARWVIGGDASFSRTAGQLGAFNGDYLRAGLFSKTELGYEKGVHTVRLNLGVEQSWIGLGAEPGEDLTTQKFMDEVQAGLLYSVQAGGIIGPYVRGQARTSLFETTYTPLEDTVVTRVDDDNNFKGRTTVRGGDELQLFEGFNPLDLRAAAGVSIDAVDTSVFKLRFLLGAAGRRATYNNGLFIQDRSAGEVEAVVIEDDESFGAEGGFEAIFRLGQTISLSVHGEAYMPSTQIIDGEDLDPVFRLDSQATFSVNQFLAVVYSNYIRKDAYEIDEAQLSHLLSVRLTHTLF